MVGTSSTSDDATARPGRATSAGNAMMDTMEGSHERLTPNCRVLVEVWRASHGALPRHPDGRCFPEAATHAMLVDLRGCATPDALFRRHFDRDRARGDLILLASLLPPHSATRTMAERLRPLFPLREAAFWLRWCELTGARPV